MSANESEIQARLLTQALPYMQRYENKTIVVKYGGHAMGNAELGRAFASDIALLKQSGVNPIVVHGGGPQIGAMLTKMGIESKFEGGLRITDEKTVE
ncbi:MAG: acetylglutamate kinase, partial [Ensifer adhaerens]